MHRLSFLRALILLICGGVFTLTAAAQGEIEITEPTPLSEVSGIVQIRGTINPPGLQTYFFEVANFADDPETAVWTPVTLPALQPVVDGVLAEWTTNMLPDGAYALRVRVVLASGEILTEMIRPIQVTNAGAPIPTAEVEAEPEVAATPEIVPRPNVINPLPIPVGGQLDTFDDAAIEHMRAAGMTWIKWQIPYVIGDANLFNVARDRINYAHRNGFYVLLSIKGSKDEMSAVGFEEYFPLYAQFLGEIAALQPDAIQVWNEMNLDREWPQGTIDPRAYVDMLRLSYEAIKAVDPTVMVITGSPAPTGAEGAFGLSRVWNDDRYYLGMANAGAAQYADCIGVHYNEGILPPTAQGGDPRGEYPTRYFQQQIQRAAWPFRNSDIPLCFSELGYLSPEGYGALPAGFAWGANTSVQEQAQWLRDAIQLAANTQNPRIELIIVFNINYTRFVEGDPQGGYAIIRPDGTCPACEAIATLRTS